MPYYQNDDRKLFYSTEGSENGHAVVFLHGYLGDSISHWGKQLGDSKLASLFSLIAPDFRGFGKSGITKWGEKFPTAKLLEDIRFLIRNHLKLKVPPILVGYSVGAAMALDYAVDFPSEVGGLCLVSPRPFTRKEARSYPFLSKDKRNKSKFKAFFWNMLKKIQKTMTTRSIKKVVKKDPERLTKLETIKHIPTMIVYADKDTVTPPIAFDILEKHLPEAEIIKFDGDHGITHEQSEKFNEVLFQFCQRNNVY
ncbi:MAG: alpha/beta fold hydrolase [Candidatus Hodarchaeales archaeon]|jgi:pimeloyl-ACP methyl ester carboxylesterase